MSLANVGLKLRSSGAKISGAVQLTEVLDIEKTSNMMAFSPKSARQARGGFSLLINTFALGVFSTVGVPPGMTSTHPSKICMYLIDPVQVPQAVGYVDQLRYSINSQS
jgi:hypothetical protein